VITAVLGVFMAALLVAFVVQLANQGGGLHGAFGSKLYDVGIARDLAGPIADKGPLLLPDLLRHDKVIYVQHLGDDPATSWFAFSALAPGSSTCVLQWDQGTQRFAAPCTTAVFLADGTAIRPGPSLSRYPTIVNGSGHVVVDLLHPVSP